MTRLTFEYDSEPYGKERDAAIIKMARNFGVETRVKSSHTLYNLDRSDMGLLFILPISSVAASFQTLLS